MSKTGQKTTTTTTNSSSDTPKSQSARYDVDLREAKLKFALAVERSLNRIISSGVSRERAVEKVLQTMSTSKEHSSINQKRIDYVMKKHSLSEEHARRALAVQAELRVRFALLFDVLRFAQINSRNDLDIVFSIRSCPVWTRWRRLSSSRAD